MSSDKLVMMANQIGRFFTPQREPDAVAAIADHLQKFWDPRMRATIVAHMERGGEGWKSPFAKPSVGLRRQPGEFKKKQGNKKGSGKQ